MLEDATTMWDTPQILQTPFRPAAIVVIGEVYELT
jgi:hypothetical protein